MKRKEFILNLIYYILPIVLIFPLSIWGIHQVNKGSYDCFFVVGSSMNPTLSGDSSNSTYGYSNNSEDAINYLERFDLIICYYPFSQTDYDLKYGYVKGSPLLDSKTLKVKRVIGLPGDILDINNETFTIQHKVNDEWVTDTYGEEETETMKKVPFTRGRGTEGEEKGKIQNRVAHIELHEEEYFVMGDNWAKNGSTDCCNPGPSTNGTPQCIYKENIGGVVFKLEGTCKYKKFNHCKNCKKIVEDGKDKCSCGGTEFILYDDIYDEVPYKDGPIYLK